MDVVLVMTESFVETGLRCVEMEPLYRQNAKRRDAISAVQLNRIKHLIESESNKPSKIRPGILFSKNEGAFNAYILRKQKRTKQRRS